MEKLNNYAWNFGDPPPDAPAPVLLDFETRSRLDLGSVCTERYATHETTEVLCAAYQVWWGEPELWTSGQPFPFYDLWPNIVLLAFHAEFEFYIWNHQMAPKFGWPRLVPEMMDCLRARAAYAGLPRKLSSISRPLVLGSSGKDTHGHKLMLKLCKPKGGKLVGDTYKGGQFIDDPEKHQRNYEYALQDVRAESILARVCPPLPPQIRELYHATHVINARGCPIDEGFCRVAHAIVRLENDRLADQLHDITDIEDITPDDLPKLKGWMAEIGVPFPRTKNGLPQLNEDILKQALAGEFGELDPRVTEVLEIRALSRDAAVTKYPKMLQYAVNGRVKNGHIFYQAGPGRFSFGGPQLQNLRRLDEKTLADRIKLADWLTEIDACGEMQALFDAYDFLSENYQEEGVIPLLGGMVRLALRAEPGNVLCVADWSSIEFRMLHWLAGDESMLAQMRAFDRGEGEDPYKLAAAEMYGKKVADVTKAERQQGKIVCLGSGYCTGAQKLQTFAEGYGIHLSMDEAKEMVQGYRRANPLVVRLWYKLQDAALAAVDGGGVHQVGYVNIYMRGRTLCIRLPSGRELKYHNAQIKEGKFGPSIEADAVQTSARRWVDMPTIVENCVAENTLVWTDTGLIPIQEVRKYHLIWDGEEFVSHGGVVRSGSQVTIEAAGIRCTPDHRILTHGGWQEAGEIASGRLKQKPIVLGLNKYVRSLSSLYAPGVEELRRARDSGMRTLAEFRHVPDGTKLREPVYDIRCCGPRSRFVVARNWNEGVVVHNCDQGSSFDLLMYATNRGVSEGLPIVLTVHDELVVESPEREAERWLGITKDIMTEGPAWSKGLPLAVGTGVDTRYSK